MNGHMAVASPRVGKVDEFYLCDVCGRNVPIKDIAGKCKAVQCGKMLCKACATTCDDCKKVFCPNDTEVVEVNGEKKRFCANCKPPTKKCFIATAAYGTPLAEEINILRKFRDNSLQLSPIGKRFIDFYYLISTPIAKFISSRSCLRKFVRSILNPLVTFLKRKRD